MATLAKTKGDSEKEAVSTRSRLTAADKGFLCKSPSCWRSQRPLRILSLVELARRRAMYGICTRDILLFVGLREDVFKGLKTTLSERPLVAVAGSEDSSERGVGEVEHAEPEDAMHGGVHGGVEPGAGREGGANRGA